MTARAFYSGLLVGVILLTITSTTLARPEADRVRTLIDSLVNDYPAEKRNHVVGPLKSSRDVQHLGSVFELILHRLAMQADCKKIEIEPRMEGRREVPDFLITDANGTRFYLEATVATGVTAEEAAGTRRRDDLIDGINSLVLRDFHLNVRWRGLPKGQPSVRDAKREIERWLAGLDFAHLRQLFVNNGAMPSMEHIQQELLLQIEAVPRTFQNLGGDRAIAGLGPIDAEEIDTRVAIREAVNHKAGKYGDPPLPYVVAVNATHQYANVDSLAEAMFGDSAAQYADLGNGWQWHDILLANGSWGTFDNPVNTRVSAVLFLKGLDSWSVADRRPVLLLNPWARRPLVGNPFGTDLLQLADGSLKPTAGRSIGELFNLNKGWPEEED